MDASLETGETAAQAMTRFSLIVPSVGRTNEVARLLDSLARQTCRDFQVILVDQNQDERLLPLLAEHSAYLPIQHLRVQSRGAARARNAGLDLAVGDILLWPDDDSWLPPDLLERMSAVFEQHPHLGGLMGTLVDELGQPHSRWVPPSAQPAALMDAFTRAAEPVLFFRRAVVQALGGFDPLLGTGAQTPWGAGEGTDLCVRAIRAQYAVSLEPALTVFHAQVNIQPGDQRQLAKARSYARGMGAVLRKNRLPLLFVAAYLFTYLRALLWNFLCGRWANGRFHWERLAGVVEGMI
jgi:glycosyltransferase involved in cell wall biosynthesis